MMRVDGAETSRGCAGPPGPDLAKRDLNPRILPEL
jgi:hypothetical protein